MALLKMSVSSNKTTVTILQAHGGMGVCQDLPLGWFFAAARSIRLADGPDEVHCRQIAKMEIRAANQPKL